MTELRNQQILGAYAILFTLALGLIALDPIERAATRRLADLPVPEEAPMPKADTVHGQLTALVPE